LEVVINGMAATHVGQPGDVIKAELARRVNQIEGFTLGDEDLTAYATQISKGGGSTSTSVTSDCAGWIGAHFGSQYTPGRAASKLADVAPVRGQAAVGRR